MVLQVAALLDDRPHQHEPDTYGRCARDTSAHIEPRLANSCKIWIHFSNDVASIHVGDILDSISAFDLGQELVSPTVVDQEEQPTSNFFRLEEKSLLDLRIDRNGVAPEVTDSSSGKNTRKRQLSDDVAEQLGSEEHSVCGGLARLLGDGSCVRRLQRARCAALGDFSLDVYSVHAVCGVEGVSYGFDGAFVG